MIMIPEPTGCHAVEVAGAEAIVTTIPEPTGRRAYGMCGAFHFCATTPPFTIQCQLMSGTWPPLSAPGY
jgi:hypothetical protein